ncbi:hypothetical protein FRC14_000370 [Serendipita sp. 396]|nr:hypothetical protein FRC14_000370 [Serendipita sp. 396]KAG8776753.1 hypothetical protein FRC15_011780 [Serendipita sp. 397]KAG8818146.1 hypothetical protein FRC19_010839 [Serendipita sp. 401]KAG8819464.1 hypothetical protein FRC18_012083 [Serendipita sp. 400]KAG8846011.1 hypothetical protein FRB91_001258 [Serendipita sp. 411]KAG8857892.1 hypothetical protein FRC20_000187 [Serendipita sp. 405]KAG9050043.1 hypothetical protein FS842_011436 [Serendipita sp. 407]
MFTKNQKANALQSLVSVYFRSTDTPERVIQIMARMGISLSTTSGLQAIASLSKYAENRVKEVGKTLLAAPAYDNINIAFKVTNPTHENQSRMVNMTTATLVMLEDAKKEDLEVCKELWSKSPYNRRAINPISHRLDTSTLFPMEKDVAGLTGVKRVRRSLSWHIIRIMLEFMAKKEHKRAVAYLKELGPTPGEVDQLPIKRSVQHPLRAMEEDESTNQGNANVCDDIQRQIGLDGTGLLQEYVQILHGDLATLERIEGNKLMRSDQRIPIDESYQHLVLVPGLFHAKMAAVNALHHIYIEQGARLPQKPTVWAYASILREKQMGHIGSQKPSFRAIHKLVLDVTTAFVIHLWTSEVGSLDKWLDRGPSMDELQSISDKLALKHVAGFGDHQDHPDAQYRNQQMMIRDFLLYSEFSHAQNTGDIGRVVDVIPFWILIWKATGKHKYAKFYHQFLLNLRTWPEALARVVRRNWLCNPKGKVFGFRGIDWLVELNNLYTKEIFSGHGPNRSIQLIKKHSILIQILQQCHEIFDNVFYNIARTQYHTPADTTVLIARLVSFMNKEEATGVSTERSVKAYIDAIARGMEFFQSRAAVEGGEEEEQPPLIDDLIVESNSLLE